MHDLMHHAPKLAHGELNILIHDLISVPINVTGGGSAKLDLHAVCAQIQHPFHGTVTGSQQKLVDHLLNHVNAPMWWVLSIRLAVFVGVIHYLHIVL